VDAAEHSLAVLGIVLLVGLLAPELLRRLHIPFVSALMVVGAALGPYGFGYIEADSTLILFAFLGATFQMLLAGFESYELDLRLWDKTNIVLVVAAGAIPAAIGAALAALFDYAWPAVLLAAAVFLSSSIMLVFSLVKHFELEGAEVGVRLKTAVVFLELASTVLAYVLLQSVDPHERFPLPILAGLVVCSVVVLRMFLPEIAGYVFARIERAEAGGFEPRLRFALAAMLICLFLYSALDVHPVVGAFFVGFALAGVDGAEVLHEKLRTIGYALFIPIFLFVVGLEVDYRVLLDLAPRNIALFAFVITAILSKVIFGYLGGRVVGLGRRQSFTFGTIASVKLAVPLATAYAALKAGIAPQPLFTATVIISVITATVSPLIVAPLARERGRSGG
jgi:Kef-type K+ transport system membrane component KefB